MKSSHLMTIFPYHILLHLVQKPLVAVQPWLHYGYLCLLCFYNPHNFLYMLKVKLSQCCRGGVEEECHADPFYHSSAVVRTIVTLIQKYCKAHIHGFFSLSGHWRKPVWVIIFNMVNKLQQHKYTNHNKIAVRLRQ